MKEKVLSLSVFARESFEYKFVFFTPVIVIFFLLLIRAFDYDTYFYLIDEDQIVEVMQVIFYLASGIVAFLASIMYLLRREIAFAVFFIVVFFGFLFVSLEEISWGQRIFKLQTTQYFIEYNRQEEITIHNMKAVQPFLHIAYMLVGLYGSFAWLVLPRIRTKFKSIISILVPEKSLILYFFPTFLIYFYLEWVRPYSMLWFGDNFWLSRFFYSQDQEVFELFLAIGVLFFMLEKIYDLRFNYSNTVKV